MTRSIIPALGPDAQRQVRAQLSVPSLTKTSSEALAGEKKNKYRNKKCEAWGIKFDSKREMERYGELRLLERADEIAGLEAHPRFSLDINGVHIGHYTADNSYWKVTRDEYGLRHVGRTIIEDIKSGPTHNTASRLRIRVFEAIYKATVRIVE